MAAVGLTTHVGRMSGCEGRAGFPGFARFPTRFRGPAAAGGPGQAPWWGGGAVGVDVIRRQGKRTVVSLRRGAEYPSVSI